MTTQFIQQKYNGNDWLYKLPENPKFIIDTDVGNDPDDVYGIYDIVKNCPKNLELVATSLYDPIQKARIAKVILEKLGLDNVTVTTGFGAYKGQDWEKDWEKNWYETYPSWPTKFKVPGITNKVSLLQGVAYEKMFKEFHDTKITKNEAQKDIYNACLKHGQNTVVILQAPPSNFKEIFDQLPNINRFVFMGGWFETKEGNIDRLGYNTAVDLGASQKILEQDKVPVLLVSSELMKQNQFVIKDKEREVMLKASYKSSLGKALCDDMHGYRDNKIPSGGELGLADMVTTYLARNPNAIVKTQPIQVKFSEELMKQNIDMFHPESKNVIQFKNVDESNVHIVKELKDAAGLRLELVLELFTLFYPHVDSQTIKDLLGSDKNAEEIALILNQKEENYQKDEMLFKKPRTEYNSKM